MNNSGYNFDPFEITSKLKEILTKGDSAELQNYIQNVMSQYGAPPFAQAFIAPLAQSLAIPLSQYFSGIMNRPVYTGPVTSEPGNPEEKIKSTSINSMLFEIHGFVVIRANIPEGINENNIKVYFTPGYITIKGDPSGEDHVVQLPPGTKQEDAKAAIKDRVLEIRIPMESPTKPDNEVGVEYL